MSYNYVTVEWTYEKSPGVPAIGRVEWYPTTPSIVDSTNDLSLDIDPQIILLDNNGAFSATLLATDNTGLSEFGWTFTPYVDGEDLVSVSYAVNFSGGATQQLDTLTEYTPS